MFLHVRASLLVTMVAMGLIGSHEVSGFVVSHAAFGMKSIGLRSDFARHVTVTTQDDVMDDAALLEMVTMEQLADLCSQCNLSTEGTKQEILVRLRGYADRQAEANRQMQLEHNEFVEYGGDDAKVKYEVLPDNEDDDDGFYDDEDFGTFYFHDPYLNVTIPEQSHKNDDDDDDEVKKPKKSKAQPITRSSLTAPPLPKDAKPNEKGERFVTTYSSENHNDLTGVAAAQPGQIGSSGDITADTSSIESAPWDTPGPKTSATSSKQLEDAKEAVTELVHSLLAMTGAPGFREEFSEGLKPYEPNSDAPSVITNQEFVGFDPSKVPTDLLLKTSKALRAGRGQVLKDVLRDYEIRGIGLDGMAADDKTKGGGHYREVSKVSAFLDGFRKAEVRRICRGTTTMLLDKVASEGVQGLDTMLGTMSRANDDTGEAGELTDSLLQYLNDAIRQQEKKVSKQTAERAEVTAAVTSDEQSDTIWKVSEEDGTRMETLDPNDPKVQDALEKEAEQGEVEEEDRIPDSVPEKILLLLKLMRDRVQAEAAFDNDEKGRNLRILSYCMKLKTDKEREELILGELKTSLGVSFCIACRFCSVC